MTSRVKEYFRRYPEPEYICEEDGAGDPERAAFFNSLTEEEQISVLEQEGAPKDIIAFLRS